MSNFEQEAPIWGPLDGQPHDHITATGLVGRGLVAAGIVSMGMGVLTSADQAINRNDDLQPETTPGIRVEYDPSAAVVSPNSLIVSLTPPQQYDSAYRFLGQVRRAETDAPLAVPLDITDPAIRQQAYTAAQLRRVSDIITDSPHIADPQEMLDGLSQITNPALRAQADNVLELELYAEALSNMTSNPDGLNDTEADEALRALLADKPADLTQYEAELQAAQVRSQQASDLSDQNRYSESQDIRRDLLSQWSDTNYAAIVPRNNLFAEAQTAAEVIDAASPQYAADRAASAAANAAYEAQCDNETGEAEQVCLANVAADAAASGDLAAYESWAERVISPQQNLRLDGVEAAQAVDDIKGGYISLAIDWLERIDSQDARARVERALASEALELYAQGYAGLGDNYAQLISNDMQLAQRVADARP